ncbi:MAG: aldehyde dehydrogenase family protein, partial [Nakamurella sp.]
IKAVGFTGSLGGGAALMKIIAERPEPIPFYGELSSLNPVVITEAAAAERGDTIGTGLVASFTVAAGQLCTKPGLVFLPAGTAGDGVVAAMTAALAEVAPQVLLNERIFADFGTGTAKLQATPGMTLIHQGASTATAGFHVAAQLVQIDAAELTGDSVDEHFGPVTVIARYSTVDQLERVLLDLPASLTATVHSSPADADQLASLTDLLRGRAGRLIYDGYPTGVSVAWAQHHGGPWPSTNSLHTSVGPTAIRRFLRPVTWQDAPAQVLPDELRDDVKDIPRRVDGRLLPAVD